MRTTYPVSNLFWGSHEFMHAATTVRVVTPMISVIFPFLGYGKGIARESHLLGEGTRTAQSEVAVAVAANGVGGFCDGKTAS